MTKPDFTQTPLATSIGAALLLMAFGAPPTVHAQASAQPPTQEVTISARKRDERAVDVPLSISVVSGDEVRDRGAIRISEVPIPNVSFLGVENNALTNFTVRGVQSQNRSNIGFDSGIGVYVDGIYMGRNAAFNQETFDVERVEFLRGPQGTLFGKNSIAGAVSIVTREPSRTFTATGSLDLGTDNQRRLSAYVSAPLGSDTVRGSIAAYSGKRDGYMDNAATGTQGGTEDVYSVRGKLLFKPSAGLDITLAGDYLKDKSIMASPHIVSGYGFIAGSSDFTSNVNVPTNAGRTVQGLGGTINYDLGNGLLLTSITSVRKLDTTRTADTDVGPTDIVASNGTSKQDQWSQELRIASNRKSQLQYVAGLYYYEQKASSTSRSTFGPVAPVFAPIRSTTGNTFGDIDTTNAAVFGNADWNVSEQLTLTGGLRYTSEKKDLAFQQDVTFPAFLAPSLPLEHDSMSTNDVTPMLSARWRLEKDAIVYGTYSKGFRSGGWNVDNVTAGGPTSFAQTRFGDETMNNYELGAKASLMEGMLNLSGAIFRMDYDDIQLTKQVQVLGGGGAVVGLVTNAGKARIDGAEIEATLRPMQALRISAGIGYADARYTDYTDTSGTTAVSFNGNRLNYAPTLTSNLSGIYTVPVPFGSLMMRLDYAHTGDYYIGRENTDAQHIPGRDLVNGRVTLLGESGHWEVALYCNNLLDDRYIVSKGPGGFARPVGAGTNQTVDYGRPRSYGIIGTFNF